MKWLSWAFTTKTGRNIMNSNACFHAEAAADFAVHAASWAAHTVATRAARDAARAADAANYATWAAAREKDDE